MGKRRIKKSRMKITLAFIFMGHSLYSGADIYNISCQYAAQYANERNLREKKLCSGAMLLFPLFIALLNVTNSIIIH